MEPFKIKMTEPLHFTDYEERIELLKQAGYNLSNLKATDVTIDLVSDSGNGAMSQEQWAEMLLGDESYAGSKSYFRFEEVTKEIFGFKHVLPVHQGRAAERILFSSIVTPGQIVPNNIHYDTTRDNIERLGSTAVDLPIQPQVDGMFNGNMDVNKLQQVLTNNKEQIPVVIITITNNSGGGQPVSMANVKAVSQLCRQNEVPLFLDACRFAENCYFIKLREPEYKEMSVRQIIREFCSYADGAYLSAKKDTIVNSGGILATNLDDLNKKFLQNVITTEGFTTSGGISGQNLNAISVGLMEGTDERYLRYRIENLTMFGEILKSNGVPILEPTGGHAVFINALKICDHIPRNEYPAWALCNAIYIMGGIRSRPIGGILINKDCDDQGTEWVRLALPRRVYTKSHLEYVGNVMKKVMEKRNCISGFRIVEDDRLLHHFTGKTEPILGRVI